MKDTAELRTLAGLHGIEPRHVDGFGAPVEVAPETLLALLRALGVPIESASQAGEAIAARGRELDRRLTEPVVVAWDGEPPALALSAAAAGRLAWRLVLESGEERSGEAWIAGAGPFRLPLAGPLPLGTHRIELDTASGGEAETLVLAAPQRAYAGSGLRHWGAFLPLYALRSRESWGIGDLGDLGRLARWIAERGGAAMASLPLLPAFLDRPLDPSPYAPLSRRFWNEIYLDPRLLPGFERCAAARELAGSAGFEAEVAALRRGRLVDYRRTMALKRRVLVELARDCRERGGAEAEAVHRFLASKPLAGDYAAFRAVQDRLGTTWQEWPERLRAGRLEEGDFAADDRWLHLWLQWALDLQVGELARDARGCGAPLYLDFPLGVHAGGFDVWREREIFALDASAGAPPDSLFTGGQDWGLPPLHPERLRATGYRYWGECLRHHLAPAGLLRIDHVMQLHRLYWVPAGHTAREGAYLRYPAEELLALLCLESHRSATALVGENLGTVPLETGAALDRHGLLGLHVRQYELRADSPPPAPRADSVAALNTHDMPTFRGYCEGRDLDDLLDLGLYDGERHAEAREERRALIRALAGGEPGTQPEASSSGGLDRLLARQLEDLAASPARWLMVNLEDLWGEGEPQNVPGTHLERPNWRRRAALSLEEIVAHPAIADQLRRIDALRRAPLGSAPDGEPGADPSKEWGSAAPTLEEPPWRAR